MDRDQIIAKLREHAPELKAAGVVHLFLHGSYARGTAIRGSSDVDVIAEFDPRRRFSLVDMVAIKNRLTDLLGVRVDLSPAKTLKEPVRDKAKREAVPAFSRASLSLADILDAIIAIEQFTQDMDLDSFRQDSKTIAAVERNCR